jgi:hypothetical protein
MNTLAKGAPMSLESGLKRDTPECTFIPRVSSATKKQSWLSVLSFPVSVIPADRTSMVFIMIKSLDDTETVVAPHLWYQNPWRKCSSDVKATPVGKPQLLQKPGYTQFFDNAASIYTNYQIAAVRR